MTNGDGGSETPASGLPLDGGGGPRGGGPLAVGQGQSGPAGPGGLPVPVMPARRDGGLPAAAGGGAGSAPRSGSRLSLSNWRVRWRLIAIIAVPTVTAMILGGIQVGNSVSNYVAFQRVQTLANLNALIVKAAGQLADERDAMAGFVASGRPQGGALQTTVNNDQAATTATLDAIKQQAGAVTVNAGYRQQTVLDLQNGVLAGIADLTFIRQAALKTSYPALAVIQSYDRLVTAFDTFSNDVAAGTGNATLQTDVSVLNALLRMEDDASLQRAYLYQALASTPPALTPVALTDLNQAFSQQQADTSQFSQAATVAEQQTLNNTVAGPQVDEAQSAEKRAIASAQAGQGLTIGFQQSCDNRTPAQSAQCWYTTQSAQINDMRAVSDQLVGQITAQANSLESTSLRNAIVISVATLVLLILVLLITTFVARSMIRPLRKLRADALEVAGTKLPEMVRRLSESEGGDESVEIDPIGVTSTDEIGEVARAFDQVHREAVRLAADEAMLRGNLNAMFVNLSRRSQSLIERQLSLIDSLEQSEQDPDRLSSLFRLDHLATRMRRNSENLLVLAGHEASRRWSQPVPLVDVLRAAISEIEQYERVVLSVQPGIAVVGHAVNDVVHLVAELVENATAFSPEDSQVRITAQPLSSGGVLVDITDSGVGISDEEMEQANRRLDSPPVVDVSVSRRMGLFVVGRLSARHGIRVRLRHAPSGGLTALVWLPDTVAVREGTPLGRLRRFEMEEHGIGPSLSAPSAGTAGRADTIPQGLSATGNAAAQAAAAARIPRFSPSAPAQPAGGVLGAGRGGAISPGSARAGYGVQDPRAAAESGRGEHGPAPAARSAAREDPAAREDSDSAASPPGPQGSGTPGSGTPGGPAPGSAAGTPGSAAGAGLGRPGASGGYGIAEMPPAAPLRR